METKFTTVEGHPVKVGKFYQTRSGNKAYVYFIDFEFPGIYPVLAAIEGVAATESYSTDGILRTGKIDLYDLMRPWGDQP